MSAETLRRVAIAIASNMIEGSFRIEAVTLAADGLCVKGGGGRKVISGSVISKAVVGEARLSRVHGELGRCRTHRYLTRRPLITDSLITDSLPHRPAARQR